MKERPLMSIVFVLSLICILPIVLRTVPENETMTSRISQNHTNESSGATTDSKVFETQNRSKPLSSNEDNAHVNTPATTQEPEAYDCSNTYLNQPIPIPIVPTQPDNLTPGRIHPPGIFPVFYDGTGKSAD